MRPRSIARVRTSRRGMRLTAACGRGGQLWMRGLCRRRCSGPGRVGGGGRSRGPGVNCGPRAARSQAYGDAIVRGATGDEPGSYGVGEPVVGRRHQSCRVRIAGWVPILCQGAPRERSGDMDSSDLGLEAVLYAIAGVVLGILLAGVLVAVAASWLGGRHFSLLLDWCGPRRCHSDWGGRCSDLASRRRRGDRLGPALGGGPDLGGGLERAPTCVAAAPVIWREMTCRSVAATRPRLITTTWPDGCRRAVAASVRD